VLKSRILRERPRSVVCIIAFNYFHALTHHVFSRQCHEKSINQQETINIQVGHFKSETTDAISETKRDLKFLDLAIKDLPNTITIAATQVYHARGGADAENDNTAEDSFKLQSDRMDDMDIHTSNEINKVIEWVTNQRKDDESKLNSLQETVEKVKTDMKDTISYAEVEDKIAIKVRELVNQIKEALLAVEEDEAEFKNVANALHSLFNSLKESKADKSEMAQVIDVPYFNCCFDLGSLPPHLNRLLNLVSYGLKLLMHR